MTEDSRQAGAIFELDEVEKLLSGLLCIWASDSEVGIDEIDVPSCHGLAQFIIRLFAAHEAGGVVVQNPDLLRQIRQCVAREVT